MEGRSIQLKDYCEVSVKCLTDKVTLYFNENLKLTNLWIVDSVNSFEVNYNPEEIVDVILFGDYINDFFSSGNWIIEKMRIWVLSESSKDVLCGLFKIAPEMIGVIPREELFKLEALPNSSIDLSNTVNLIYGGRINEVKNCDFLLHVYAQLEKIKKFKLHFFGRFDEQRYLDRPAPNVYKDHFDTVLKSIEWISPPLVHGDKKQNEWLDQEIDNQVFINLSTYEKEDFSVSATQAAERSLPLVLSNWGGHRGFSNTQSSIFLRDDLMAKHNEPEDLLKVKSILVATKIMDDLENLSRLPFASEKREDIKPKIMSSLSCDKIRRDYILKNVSSLNLLASRRWFEFANQFSGDQELEKFSKLMSGEKREKYFLIAVPGLLTNKDRIQASNNFEKLLKKIESVVGECRLKVIDSKFLKLYLTDNEMNIEGSILFTADGSFVEL